MQKTKTHSDFFLQWFQTLKASSQNVSQDAWSDIFVDSQQITPLKKWRPPNDRWKMISTQLKIASDRVGCSGGCILMHTTTTSHLHWLEMHLIRLSLGCTPANFLITYSNSLIGARNLVKRLTSTKSRTFKYFLSWFKSDKCLYVANDTFLMVTRTVRNIILSGPTSWSSWLPVIDEDGGDREDMSGIQKALRSSNAHCYVYEDGSMEENGRWMNWSGIHKQKLLG